MNLGIDTIILFASIKRNDHWSGFIRNKNFHSNSESVHCFGTCFGIFVLHITLGHLLGRFVGKFGEILICLIFYVTKANHASEIITSRHYVHRNPVVDLIKCLFLYVLY